MGKSLVPCFLTHGFYIAYVIHYGVLVSRCGWERITWRQNRVAVGRSAPSASTASGASSRCRAPSGTASRRRTASRSGRGRRCVTGTRAARTRHRVTSATWPQPPACPRHKSATGSRTGASETAPHSLSARASLTHPSTVFAVYRFYTIPHYKRAMRTKLLQGLWALCSQTLPIQLLNLVGFAYGVANRGDLESRSRHAFPPNFQRLLAAKLLIASEKPRSKNDVDLMYHHADYDGAPVTVIRIIIGIPSPTHFSL